MLPLRFLHMLGDRAAQADDRHLLDPVAPRRPARASGCRGRAPTRHRRRGPPGVMRPPGPLPGTNCSSMPRSQARRRTAGEASGFWPGRCTIGSGAACRADDCPSPALPLRGPSLSRYAGRGRFARRCRRASSDLPLPACGERVGVRGWARAAPRLGDGCGGTASVTLPSPATSSTTSSEPTGRLSPGCAVDRDDLAGDRRRHFDRRLVGHHLDERVVLADRLPGATCQATISASAVPSPISGSLTT